MPKGQNLISHVKITNTSSGKVVTLDGAEADSVITQIDSLTSENRNKAYIRYEDPATKNKIALELCCVEIERLQSTVEEFDARECELDCCEQQFFSTFKTSINQQTGEFPKKSQPSVPDKKKDDSSTPDKPSVDTPTKPSENGSTDSGSTTTTTPSENTGSTTPSKPSENGGTDNGNVSPSTPSENGGSTDSGNVTPSNPSENNSGTDNGNTGTTEPTTPSENNGNSDSGTSTKPSENNGSTDSGSVTPSQPSDNTNTRNTGNTDGGTSTKPSENNGTTPSNPTENGGSAGNTDGGNTDSGSTNTPSDDNGETSSLNKIILQDVDKDYKELFEFDVIGDIGEQVLLGDFIEKELKNNPNAGKLNEDGTFEKNGIVYALENGKNLKYYRYVIRRGNSDENSFTYEYIPLKRITKDTSSDRG